MAMHNIMARVHKSRAQLKTGAESNETVSNNNRYYKRSVGHKPSTYTSHNTTEYKPNVCRIRTLQHINHY
jgi:hypothetical protein